MSNPKKHVIKTQFSDIIQQNPNCNITEISIIHRTGRPRIIFKNGNIYDISFDDLILEINENKESFCNELLVKFCSFSKKQVDRLINNIPYRINSKKFKDGNFGFSEIMLTYAKDKHLKTVTLIQ